MPSMVERSRALLLVVAIALIAWGAVGLYQGLNSGFSGGLYDPTYTVPGVRPGSLAERSGFNAGDRIISVESIPVERLGMESRWPRALAPRIGESRRFVVERNGERVALDVVYPAPFAAAVSNRIRAALVGLAFLGIGLWSWLSVGTLPAQALGKIGLAAGGSMAFGLGPNLGSWNGIQGHVATALNVLIFVLLLRFFLMFPKPKALSQNRLMISAIYGAWGCLLIFLVVELIVHPALYYSTGSVTGPMMLAFSLLTLAAFTHTLVKTTRADLRDSGMYLILGGFLLAILGIAVTFFTPVRHGGWIVSLAMVAIPLTMALAIQKHAAWVVRHM